MRTPPSAHRAQLSTHAQYRERTTWTPLAAAATASSRVACTRRPNREALNSRATSSATSTAASAHQIVVVEGIP